MRLNTLQGRIIAFFVVLTFATQLGVLALTRTVGFSNARHTIGEQLQTAERIFRRLISQNGQQLAQAARILSSELAFRQAIASGDHKTIASALSNHGARINSQVMMLVGLDGMVAADTRAEGLQGRPFPFPALLRPGSGGGSGSTLVVLGTDLYQLVVVPVLAPAPIALVAMGFAVNDRTASDLKELSGLDISFVTRHGGQPWRLQASTLAESQRRQLPERLYGAIAASGVLEDGEYVTLISPQSGAADTEVAAVLQERLEHALAPFRRLQQQLLGIAALGIVITLLGSLLIVRGIARPVRQLAVFARRIAAGDYTAPPRIARRDEIGDLSAAFEHMSADLAVRESRISILAYRDTLTGLPNRALFNERLQQAIALSRRLRQSLSVLIMDLDQFKYGNDTLGHHAGDLLLQEVAHRLERVLRRDTDTVSRLGGDEFAILLPTEEATGAETIARKVLSALDEPMTLEGHIIDVRASIGVAVCPEHGDDLATLLRRADVAMYLAKRNNTGFAVYDPQYDQHSAERLSLLGELRRAVEQDELTLYYQPKVRLDGHAENFVEALVRWQHPQRGLVGPPDFIPFAEQTGYIKFITQWVLNEAVRQCARWRSEGLTINVSINISARDLLSPELPQRFAEMLAQHDCDAPWIWLEITESAIFHDPGHALANLERLRAQGCRISIDDYGTGYSSLAYLKRLPVDELKIDRSFVNGMVENHNDEVIVRSTIELAHNLGLKVVAEGVETPAMLRRLQDLHCDMAQGFLLSRPIPARDIPRWMRESPWAVEQAGAPPREVASIPS
jgi:diguanylate cyclase (GGDEF)-like protein